MLRHHAKYHDGHIPDLNQYSNSNRGFSQVASKHRAKYNGDRLQELKQYSGCHRGFGKDKHDDSESDLESERRGVLILHRLPPAAINHRALLMSLMQRKGKEKTPRHLKYPYSVNRQDPVVPGVALQVHGDLGKQRRDLLMI